MSVPYFYNVLNVNESHYSPNAMNVDTVQLTNFFRRYLLQKAMSVAKWTLPEEWPENFFLYTLYSEGKIAIINTDKYGVIPMNCQLSGYNVFYQPSEVLIANPLLRAPKPLVIDQDCVLFTLQPDYGSIMDLVDYYANQMALAASSYSINLNNSKLAYAFGAGDKNAAESFKKAADRALSGQPYVVVDKELFGDKSGKGTLATQFFQQNLSQNFIAPAILDTMKTLENQFATEIGLPNANTDKKERMLVDEINANNVETSARADMWMQSWKKSCRKAKEKYGVDISVEWRVKPNELGGAKDDLQQTIPNGTL